MNMQAMGGTSPFDRETFGAAVVSKTLDYMHGTASPAPGAFDKKTFGAAVVGKTLDYMNTNQNRFRTENTYQFQKDVLMPVYTGRGTLLDDSV